MLGDSERGIIPSAKLDELNDEIPRYFRAYYSELRRLVDEQGARSEAIPESYMGYKKVLVEAGTDGVVITHIPASHDAVEDTFKFTFIAGASVADITEHKALRTPSGMMRVDPPIGGYEPGADFGALEVTEPLTFVEGDLEYQTPWTRLDMAHANHLNLWQDEAQARTRAKEDLHEYLAEG
jgi:hypothetical protein